jgi:hypothetical protein
MSTEAWKDFGQRFVDVLGECEPAFGTPLVSAEQDEQTRADGVTDDLLAAVAPSATGDTIAVLNVIGYRAQTASSSSAPAPKPAPQPAQQMRRGRRGMGGGAPRETRPASSKDPFEVELRLYSVAEKKTVGVIAMKSEATDFGPFIDRLRKELPNARCAGWKLPSPAKSP